MVVGSAPPKPATAQQSWDGTSLGTQWDISCAVENTAFGVVDNRVGGNGTVALRRPGESAFTAKHIQLGNGQTPAFTAAVGDAGAFVLTSDLGAINSKVQ